MMQPETYEQIELYLLGKLSGPDLLAFEQRLANEPDFEKEVSLQREVFYAIRLEGKADSFRRQLEGIEKKMAPDVPVRRIVPIRRWLALAAGLALLFVAGWWFSNKQTTAEPMTSKALFAAHFLPPESISTAAMRDADTTENTQLSESDQQWNTLWENMERLYALREFEGALASLKQIQALDPAGEYASETFYYSGLMHLQMGQVQLALEAFEKVSVGHIEDKTWYSALAFLALNRPEDAKKLLKVIVAENYVQKPAALKILAKI
jgi:tetratricopeptide (TPR) repeat protein